MIEETPLLEVARTLKRPAAAKVEAFRGVSTCFIADAMGGRGALDWRLKPIGFPLPFVGVALTCDCGPADNLAACLAVARCRPGDVIIAASGGYTGAAVIGDLLLGIARNRGAAAFVTDGLVRDVNDIEALDFPCFALGLTPNSPARHGPGSVGLPIQCGGQRVATGDIIAGDRDGVVIVPFGDVSAVLERLKAVRAAEAGLAAKVKAGLAEVSFLDDAALSSRIRTVES